ncbi:hypothetical protein BgiBS90_032083 [Biomphalaria glabrata]|nr:hypothetical protein BgiBS90_032083 [Biomphalaria glabrata]
MVGLNLDSDCTSGVERWAGSGYHKRMRTWSTGPCECRGVGVLEVLKLVNDEDQKKCLHISKRRDACLDLEQCSEVLNEFDTVDFLNIVSLTEEENYILLCQSFVTLQVCYDKYKDDCKNPVYSTKVMHYTQALEYLCSDEVKEALKAMSISPCSTVDMIQLSTLEAIADCMSNNIQEELWTSKSRSINFCFYLKTSTNCSMEAVRNNCGSDFAGVMEKLLDMNFNSASELLDGCNRNA